MNVNVKKLSNLATVPTHGTAYSAGYDLYACMENPVAIKPHSTVKISTGLSMEIPFGWFGAVFARSGLATKKGLRPSNCVGVVDSDYRGEVIVALHNDTEDVVIVSPNERIAQLVLMRHEFVDWREVEELTDTTRGTGGFGSTGK